MSTGPADRDDLLDAVQAIAEAEAEADEQARAFDPADIDLDSCANPGLAVRALEDPDDDQPDWRRSS